MSTHALTERYLAEDVYEDVLGMLENDDSLPVEKRIPHRQAHCRSPAASHRVPQPSRDLCGLGAAPEMPPGRARRGVCLAEAMELGALAALRGRELLLEPLEALLFSSSGLGRQVGTALAPAPGADEGRGWRAKAHHAAGGA